MKKFVYFSVFAFSILMIVSCKSESQKRIEKIRLDLQVKKERIKAEKDSIWIEDSLKFSEASKVLYEKEGEHIIKDFYFGMSHEDFDSAVVDLSKTASGLIKIGNQDFVIKYEDFFENKLYQFVLYSANTWIRYYYTDCFEYDDIDGDDDGSEKAEAVRNELKKRFGPPNNGEDWFFLNKNVSVKAASVDERTEGLLRTERWAVIVSFKNPLIYR